jgi:hypothetical protein
MKQPRTPQPTISFIDQYCRNYQKIFSEVLIAKLISDRQSKVFKFFVNLLSNISFNIYSKVDVL